MAAGVGVAVGNNKASKVDAAYSEIATLDLAANAPSGSTSTQLTNTTLKDALNAGSSVSNLVTSASITSGKVYNGKGSGGGSIPQATLKSGTASAASAWTFTIGGSDNITKVVINGHVWKTTTTVSVNSSSGQTYSTAQSATAHPFEFELSTATKTINVSVGTSALCISSIVLYKTVSSTSYSYSVTYNGNGNTGGTLPSTQSGSGTSITLSSNILTKSDFIHDGWATSTNGTKEYDFGETISLTGTLNLSLYAHWVPSYTISYNSNGGTGSMSSTSGANPEIAACSFTAPSGKVFSRWNSSQDGSGTNYEVGSTPGANLTLYAIWSDGVTYDFSEIDGLASWGTSYNSHSVTYTQGTVTFASASKQSSTISDIPVTKGGDVSFVAATGYTLTTVTFVCRQWSDKAQTITLHYSTDGGTNYTSTGITSTNFSITKNGLITGTNAVKITFSSSSNQVGIESLTIGYVQNTTPLIGLDKNATNVTPSTTDTISVSYSHLTANISVTQSSENGGTVVLSLDDSTYSNSLSLNYQTASPQTIYVKGSSTGTVSLSFSSTGATAQVCTVTVTAPRVFEKITTIAKIKDGGNFVIVNSEEPSTAMSTTQNNNNRGYTTATLEDGNIVLGNTTTVSVITIEKGTGDYASYYTLFEESSSKYLYAISGSNYLRSDATVNSDYFYWSISFDSGDALITNKGNSYILRWNGTNSIFSCYGSGQAPVALYELQADIPEDVPLLSITASNSSVQVGSTITFSGTYSPTNATENILVTTLDDTYATAGNVTMNSGTFSVSITGVSATEGTSLVFEGEDGNGTASVTLVVVSYTPTHDLVTSAANLANGSRVVIGCTDTDYNYIAEHSTGGNNLNAVTSGFADDKSTLAASSSEEFVVWCIDSTNGYYVFSDGDYYLASPTTKNNYLLRTDVLSEACYFTIEDNANGISVKNSYGVDHSWGSVSSAYTLEFNSSTNKFSLYGSSQKAASLYLSKESVDAIQGFIDVFMHMNSYDTNNGYCADNSHHYYADAKAAFSNQLSAAQRQTFCTSSAYASAYARLSSWADNNGDKIDTNYSLVQKSNINLFGFSSSENTNTIAIIVIISMVSVTAIGGYFFIRRRKEN